MEQVEIIPKSYPTKLLQKDWTQRKCFYNKTHYDILPLIHDMDVLDDDVWLVTLPKSGTTWMQELLWLVLNDFDFEAAKRVDLSIRSPTLGFDFLINGSVDTAMKLVEDLKSPRLIKSHLSLPLLPKQVWNKKPKLIYVYRDQRDALVSSFHFMRNIGIGIDMNCEGYIKEYMEHTSMMHLPFEHVTEFYALRQEPWIFYTSFERMKLNLRSVINEICTFLNKSITEEQMLRMLNHLSFESMKENSKTNHIWEFEQFRDKIKRPYIETNFVRKGKVGGYTDELSSEFIVIFDKWMKDQLSKYNLTLNQLLLLEEDVNEDEQNT